MIKHCLGLLVMSASIPPLAGPCGAVELTITSPANGARVDLGKPLIIRVTASPNYFKPINVFERYYEIGMVPISQSPYVFSGTIVRSAGPYIFVAEGTTLDGAHTLPSVPVVVDAEPSEKIASLKIIGGGFELGGIGWGIRPHVSGTFADGSVIELDKSTLISCSVPDNNTVTVDATCLIIATGVGKTTLTVTYDNQKSAQVPVYVQNGPRRRQPDKP